MCIFQTDWWQTAVGRGVRSKLGIRYLMMPQLTPWVSLTDGAEKLGLWYYYEQTVPGEARPDDLEKKGYTITERVTYRIHDLSDIATVEKRFSENKKRQIKKAADLTMACTIADGGGTMTAEDFYDFHVSCLRKRGKECNYTRDFFLRLAKAVFAHNSGAIITLYNKNSEPCAAAFLVYDDTYCYYLVPTFDPEKEKSGASARLAQESIRFAANKGLGFDFEGSMHPGIANHYRQFGSSPITYYSVERTFCPLFGLALWTKKICKKVAHLKGKSSPMDT